MIRELSIQVLDEEKATLRLVEILAWNQMPITRLNFISQCKKRKIGTTAFYSSLEALKKLGLVEDVKDEINGRVVPIRDIKSLAEAICDLLQNKDKREKFNSLNRHLIEEKADQADAMKRMDDLYKSAICQTRVCGGALHRRISKTTHPIELGFG